MTRTRATIGILGVAVVGLAVALGISLASAGDDSHKQEAMGNGYAGMMGAMGTMDSDAMLARMKETLGAEGFARMQQHVQDHRSGTPATGMTDVDQMMHKMMDGMMAAMPADSSGILPQADAHHETPTASAGR